MPLLSNQIIKALLEHGLKIDTPCVFSSALAFRGPCCINPSCQLVRAKLDSFSKLASNVFMLKASLGRYSSVQEYSKLGYVMQDYTQALCSPAFHKSACFEYIEDRKALVSEFEFIAEPDKSRITSKIHHDPDLNVVMQREPHAPMDVPLQGPTIGHDVFIESRVTIYQPVTIGHGAIIKTGAVISKDVPPYAIVEGYDSIKGYRFSDEVISDLLELAWWQYNIPEMLKQGRHIPMRDPAGMLQFFKDADPQSLIKLPETWHKVDLEPAFAITEHASEPEL